MLVVDGPHTIWADVGGGSAWNVPVIAQNGATALAFKISEGAGYIDPAGKYHHDAAINSGLFPIPYVFPLPAAEGMSIQDQAKRDADLIHGYHGSFNNIGVMLDCEREPGFSNWGPWLLSPQDAALYVAVMKDLTGLKVGGYTGYAYQYSGAEKFDWRVVPNYSYSGAMTDLHDILYNINGGVTWMPNGGAYRQFTDAVDIAGRDTDFNIAPVNPALFLATVGKTPLPPPPPPPPLPNRYFREPTIEFGVNDNSFPVNVHPVKDWQGGLNSATNSGLIVDGVFGGLTGLKTQAFQRFFGLQVDGIVGPKTWYMLAIVLDKEGK